MSIRGLFAEAFTVTSAVAFVRFRREKGRTGKATNWVLRMPMVGDAIYHLFHRLSQLPPGRPIFPYSPAGLSRHLSRLSRRSHIAPPPLGRFTSRSLRIGCISAAHAIGVPLSRIMALSGHTSPPIMPRHYIDATIPPCSSARELFGRLLPPSS
jgi:hypothetical protein